MKCIIVIIIFLLISSCKASQLSYYTVSVVDLSSCAGEHPTEITANVMRVGHMHTVTVFTHGVEWGSMISKPHSIIATDQNYRAIALLVQLSELFTSIGLPSKMHPDIYYGPWLTVEAGLDVKAFSLSTSNAACILLAEVNESKKRAP